MSNWPSAHPKRIPLPSTDRSLWQPSLQRPNLPISLVSSPEAAKKNLGQWEFTVCRSGQTRMWAMMTALLSLWLQRILLAEVIMAELSRQRTSLNHVFWKVRNLHCHPPTQMGEPLSQALIRSPSPFVQPTLEKKKCTWSCKAFAHLLGVFVLERSKE